MNADGSNVQQITHAPLSTSRYPTWSPDGTRIAFSRVFPPPANEWWIHTADSDDGANLDSVPNAAGLYPTWSPDGRSLAFEVSCCSIWKIDAVTGGNLTRLTFFPNLDFAPTWSPDGQLIAFIRRNPSSTDAYSQVYVMNADGSNASPRAPLGNAHENAPRWSPDGTMIVWSSDRGGGAPQIYVMGADGSNPVNLSRTWTTELFPAWQPRANGAPVAVPGGPYSGQEGASLAFDGRGSSDPDGDVLSYSWDFGDGTPLGVGATPIHSYADNGTYLVRLSVSDGRAADQATVSVPVANLSPSGVPGAPVTALVNTPFTISLAGSDPSPVDAASLLYRFNCGAGWGASQSQNSTTCTISTPGVFVLRFAVRDKELANANYQRSITVVAGNAAPIVNLTSSSVVTVPLGSPVAISGSFIDAAADGPWQARVVWGAGQGTTNLGSVALGQTLSATHVFTSRGTFAAKLEVKDRQNTVGRAAVTVTVQ